MTLKSISVPVENLKVGDIITNYNVMERKVDRFKISLIRNSAGSDRFAVNYADPDTGQEVNYFTADRGDEIFIIRDVD